MSEFLSIFFKNLFELFTTPAVVFFLLVILITFSIKNALYKKTTYYAITHTPYFTLLHDSGKLGEYMTYKHLKKHEKLGWKFLFNVYVPKEDSLTTEIDVLAISPKGIFVFESKNYSGWIFGTEKQKNWTQVLPQGRGKSNKEHFLNPIIQNKGHIKYLKNLLGSDIAMHSVIVFSERCTLKDVTLKTDSAVVIQRGDLRYTVAQICSGIEKEQLSQKQIDDIYAKLYPFTQVDAEVKTKHILDINSKKASLESPATTIIPEECSSEEQPCTNGTVAVALENISLKCPKCGGDLVLRVAKRGDNKGKEFYGCSNYPKCKYIQS